MGDERTSMLSTRTATVVVIGFLMAAPLVFVAEVEQNQPVPVFHWQGRSVRGPGALWYVATSPEETGGDLQVIRSNINASVNGLVLDDYAFDQAFYDTNLAQLRSFGVPIYPVVYADQESPFPARTVSWEKVVLVISPLAMRDYIEAQSQFLTTQQVVGRVVNANASAWASVVKDGIAKEQALYPGSEVYLLAYHTQYSGWEYPLPTHYLAAFNQTYAHEAGFILWN